MSTNIVLILCALIFCILISCSYNIRIVRGPRKISIFSKFFKLKVVTLNSFLRDEHFGTKINCVRWILGNVWHHFADVIIPKVTLQNFHIFDILIVIAYGEMISNSFSSFFLNIIIEIKET